MKLKRHPRRKGGEYRDKPDLGNARRCESPSLFQPPPELLEVADPRGTRGGPRGPR